MLQIPYYYSSIAQQERLGMSARTSASDMEETFSQGWLRVLVSTSDLSNPNNDIIALQSSLSWQFPRCSLCSTLPQL
eukprot:727782-Amphidinium_carterae.1